MSDNFSTKQIHELKILSKLTGIEYMLVDNGEDTRKITVDSLLGYIANQVNQGTIPEDLFSSTSTIVIEEDENLLPVDRLEGNFYINKYHSSEARIYSGLPTSIKVSPSMGLKLIQD